MSMASRIINGGQESWARNCVPGTFGENLTISGLESATFNIGDMLHIGDVTLQVTAPRIPCSTFAARMNDPHWMKKFRQAERPGSVLPRAAGRHDQNRRPGKL